ncbi:MAG TPA: DUF6748 domain-containing protein [Kofleriaceae bacterium]|jgi:hypothetical protein|nr:DUF6748 domain-containing protein [Kofleriaceae bacterium]
MHRRFGVTTLYSTFLCAVAGCSQLADDPDELVGESTNQETIDRRADSATGDAYTYYEVTADLRRCASPLCGGWFLRRLNRPTTRCHDGREAEACYTPVLDWSEANVPDVQQTKLLDASHRDAVSEGVYAIARGQFAPTNTTPRPELGRFVVSEAWVAEGDSVSQGEFVRVRDNGRRCPAAPCPHLTETTLNTPRSANIAQIDWTPSGLSDRQIEAFRQAMFTPDGVLIAGYRYLVHDNGRTAKGRTATAAYHRLSDAAPGGPTLRLMAGLVRQ